MEIEIDGPVDTKIKVVIPEGYIIVTEGETQEGDKIYRIGTGLVVPGERLLCFPRYGVEVDNYYLVIRPI